MLLAGQGLESQGLGTLQPASTRRAWLGLGSTIPVTLSPSRTPCNAGDRVTGEAGQTHQATVLLPATDPQGQPTPITLLCSFMTTPWHLRALNAQRECHQRDGSMFPPLHVRDPTEGKGSEHGLTCMQPLSPFCTSPEPRTPPTCRCFTFRPCSSFPTTTVSCRRKAVTRDEWY